MHACIKTVLAVIQFNLCEGRICICMHARAGCDTAIFRLNVKSVVRRKIAFICEALIYRYTLNIRDLLHSETWVPMVH